MSVCKAGVEVHSEFAGYKDTDKETGTDGGTGTGTTGTRHMRRVMEGDQRAHTMNYKEWVTRIWVSVGGFGGNAMRRYSEVTALTGQHQRYWGAIAQTGTGDFSLDKILTGQLAFFLVPLCNLTSTVKPLKK